MLRILHKFGNKKGQALIVAYVVIACILIISGALFFKAVTERNLTLRNKLTTQTLYLAEGAVENAIAAFTTAIANYQVAPDIATMNVNTVYTTFHNTSINAVITRLQDNERSVTEGQTNVSVRNYEVAATATHPQNNGIVVTVHQIIARRLIPTFQHAVFYDQDLEILPGKGMTLTGRIHSNKSIYLDAEGSGSLKIDSFYLRSAGGIFNHRKDNSSKLMGDVSIRVNQPGPAQYDYMDNKNVTLLDSDTPDWTTEALNRWQGTVQSSAHGVANLSTPAVASIQPDGYYANQANVVIINEQIIKNGVTLRPGLDYPTGTISTSTVFYNNREEKHLKMTTIDLSKLAGVVPAAEPPCPTCTNNLPANGLLYVTRDDAGTSEEPGIKLVKGSEIIAPATTNGLTLVSNNPVYIKGDFNTLNEKSTSVICDSINLLSNSWNDANSTLGLSLRKATATTVNTAIIAGIDETTPDHYNGGLENYPRLHEDWSSINLNIKGSFVALWNSSVARGAWLYGAPQYTAPNRNWSYNPAFNDVSKLPPFTPWAVEAKRIAWWTE